MTDASRLIRRGRCHVLGDEVSLDGGIIPQRFAAQRITEPRELIPHIFGALDPGLAQRIKPGDIVLAGRNFACGKPRLQGFIAMAALDLAIVCESMPYRMWRRAVARGLPVIVGAPPPTNLAQLGDELEIDFSTGALRNLTRQTRQALPPMPPILRDIVAGGGMQAALKSWLAAHPEQA
jgi:3-isopropylmalate/(R)-2-methylmalate dehydratase small subunit